ncbi:MAG: glycosyltransferase 87 family protein, partial [Anaerolineaceae bacterium]|nr:glycosyltransferase 87 family protein [Anaerolineaceae bacterium]
GVVFMKNGKLKYSLNFKHINWMILILIITGCLNIFAINVLVVDGSFFSTYGADYLAYWSAGKIADHKGYSEIYDLNNLGSVQTQELTSLGVLPKTDGSAIPILPVAYLSFFVLPFQILSRIDLVDSYWIWTILNLIILIGYLVFYLRKTLPESGAVVNGLKLFIPVLISYPVFYNIIIGQVEVLLVVCAGEFIRNAVRKKSILSGLWLGGLLVKPQLLILIIPIIIILRNWKVLMGFVASSGIILVTSFILSGSAGIKGLINLWTRYSVGIATGSPEAMINWRMVGLNLNNLFNTSLGWIVSGFGMVLTILALYFLLNKISPFGSPSWVTTMLGVFSATLAITWHAHQHMAMILIPFLVYSSLYNLLPKKILFLWVIVTPVVWFGMVIGGALTLIFAKMNIFDYQGMVVAFSGFALNLVILFSTIRRKIMVT